jgi:hypothetical protein
MSDRAAPTDSTTGDRAVSRNVELLNGMMERRSDPAEVHAAMLALTDDELVGFGLNAFRINLTSLFGGIWPTARIARAARGATISKMWLGWEYHHHYLPRLTAAPEPPRLERCPVEAVHSLVAAGRGLLIALFHHGHMRDVPSDLAHAGIPVTVPLARDSWNDYETARQHNPGAALWSCLKYHNVEETRGALAMAKTLAGRGVVVSTIDGNTGIDGPRGNDRRVTVNLLACAARVKDGLVRMAARFGVPVLPIMARSVDGRPSSVPLPIVDPGRPLSGSDADLFVHEALQTTYAALGREIEEAPDQWCGGDLFHQWRIPDTAAARDASEVERDLQRDLVSGASATINSTRIVTLPGRDELLWTDARTLRCYRIPQEMAGAADRLSSEAGLDQAWLDGQAEASRSRIWSFMCQLAARDAIHSRSREGRQ